MIAGDELGMTFNQPYAGWSAYYNGAYVTENPKFLPIATQYPRLRIIANVGYGGAGTTYPNGSTISVHVWAEAIKAYKPTQYILYGATNNLQGYNPQTYSVFSTYLQQEASWAQGAGIDAFFIGNENLISTAHTNGGMTVATLARASNVATATFSTAHGLTTGDYIFVSGATPTTFNVADSGTVETVQVTVTNATTITYPNTGVDESASGTIKMNWSALETVRKVKALGVICQAIFTRGPIVYSESQGWADPWITEGFTPGTDIDLWGINGYGDGTNGNTAYIAWKAEIDACWAAFEEDLIITEHNVVQDSGNPKVFNFHHENKGAEYWFDKELIRRYEYAKNLGITQIYLYGTVEYPFFCNTYPDNASYISGRNKPVIKRMMEGGRESEILLGTNTLT